MSTTGIITSTVAWFEKQADRTKIRVKRDGLDTLTELWVGPSGYEDTFVPVFGSPHPNYPLMTVLNTNVHRMPAAMCEVRVEYHGKLDARVGNQNPGAKYYYSQPTIDTFWSDGEVGYTTRTTVLPPGVQAVTWAYTGVEWVNNQEYAIGQYIYAQGTPAIISWSRRYTGRGCRISYITNQKPSGLPLSNNEFIAQDYLGFINVFDIRGTTSVVNDQFYFSSGIVEQMACTDVSVSDSADGWYAVKETYQSRLFPEGG